MAKFTVNSVEVDAFQMGKAQIYDRAAWPVWLDDAFKKGPDEIGAVMHSSYPFDENVDPMRMMTDTGIMPIAPDDWIVLDPNGKLSTRKPATFAALFKPVTQRG